MQRFVQDNVHRREFLHSSASLILETINGSSTVRSMWSLLVSSSTTSIFASVQRMDAQMYAQTSTQHTTARSATCAPMMLPSIIYHNRNVGHKGTPRGFDTARIAGSGCKSPEVSCTFPIDGNAGTGFKCLVVACPLPVDGSMVGREEGYRL
jgi:hypothetical protein